MAFESTGGPVSSLNMEEHLSGYLGASGYQIVGFIFFLFMGWTLYRIATSKEN